MAKRDLIWMIITLLLAVPGVALPEAPQSDAVFKSQLEKLRTARDSWEKALSLEEILPKVREAQRKLLPIAPHLVENQTRIYAMELLMTYEKRCNSKRSDVNEHPFWYVQIGQKTLSDGGGLCLFFDARTGEKLSHKLTE